MSGSVEPAGGRRSGRATALTEVVSAIIKLELEMWTDSGLKVRTTLLSIENPKIEGKFGWYHHFDQTEPARAIGTTIPDLTQP